MRKDYKGAVTELGSQAIAHVVEKWRKANRECDWCDKVSHCHRACCQLS